MENKNCFILLQLSPDLDDEKVIKNEIKKKQAEWSRNAIINPNPEIVRSAQQSLENLGYINEIMTNPEKRKEEARKAKIEIAEIRESKKTEYENAVELLSKGSVNEQAIKNLASKFKNFFYTEKDIRETLSKFEINTSSTSQTKNKSTTGLDSTIIKAIKDNLRILKKESLYDFLGRDKNQSNETLLKEANAISLEIYKSPSVTTEGSIKHTLVGHCLSIFGSEEKRKEYDRSLADEKLTPLYEMIDGACDAGSIEIDQVLFLLEKSAQDNADTAEVLRIIRLKAQKRGVPVNIADSLTFLNNIRCICKNVNKPLLLKCEKCGTSLYYKCSKCNKSLAIDSLSCSCGYSLEKIYHELKIAYDCKNAEGFMKLWEGGKYENHPAFQEFAIEYNKLKKTADERERAEKSANERISSLEEALKNNNKQGIFSSWDESLLQYKPELAKYLPQIRDAYKPADIKNVEGFNFSSYILVRWELPENVNNYRVAWSTSSFPRNPSDGDCKELTRGEYERKGFRIDNPAQKDYFIKVYSSTTFRGEELISEGASQSCQIKISSDCRIKIQYSLSFKGFLKKDKAIITLKPDRDLNCCPEIAVVAKLGNIIPVDISSGKIIKTFSGLNLKSGNVFEQSFNIPDVTFPSRFRLFVSDRAEEKRIELVKDPSSKI
jgi:hypothetical protein